MTTHRTRLVELLPTVGAPVGRPHLLHCFSRFVWNLEKIAEPGHGFIDTIHDLPETNRHSRPLGGLFRRSLGANVIRIFISPVGGECLLVFANHGGLDNHTS